MGCKKHFVYCSAPIAQRERACSVTGLAIGGEFSIVAVAMNLRSSFPLFFYFASMLASFAAEPTPAPQGAARATFGAYEAIVMDKAVLQNVKVDADGAIYLMFVPEKRGATVKIRISMGEGSQYRKWTNGQEDLVAQENGTRQPNTWTDQVKTTANFIEYRAGEHLFLHLKKIK